MGFEGSAPVGDVNRSGRHAIWLLAIVGLAVALRFWRLGDWNFEATEMFTLRDSLVLRPGNPRPLSYLLNYYLVRPFLPLNEFSLRLLPALFGVLTIPAFYYVTRKLIGSRPALFGAFLLTLSELHIFYSQFARYWALVILLCAIYPFAIYLGIRGRQPGMVALGVVAAILAALAHPVSVLLAGGPAIWLTLAALRPRTLKKLWTYQSFRWGVLIGGVLLALAAISFVPVLLSWIRAHDANPGFGQFFHRPQPNGVKQMVYLASFVESLTLPLVLTAIAGIYLLWLRDRVLALFLTSLALFPIVFLLLVSLRTAISQFYFVPAIPVFFIGAGVFLDRLFRVDWRVRPQWLLPTVITLVVATADGSSLMSHYRNGRRFQFRQVAEWLQPRVVANDVVISDQPMVLRHYLPGPRVENLQSGQPFARTLETLGVPASSVLWVVAPGPGHAFRPTLQEGGVGDWVGKHCQLRTTIGKGRFDFRQQFLQVYRCAPRSTEPAA
jgi:hypothetical protein